MERKILIVDDDTDLLELLAIRLTAAGYKTETVQSAEAALNHLVHSAHRDLCGESHLRHAVQSPGHFGQRPHHFHQKESIAFRFAV